jgi:hypothetical protein
VALKRKEGVCVYKEVGGGSVWTGTALCNLRRFGFAYGISTEFSQTVCATRQFFFCFPKIDLHLAFSIFASYLAIELSLSIFKTACFLFNFSVSKGLTQNEV